MTKVTRLRDAARKTTKAIADGKIPLPLDPPPGIAPEGLAVPSLAVQLPPTALCIEDKNGNPVKLISASLAARMIAGELRGLVAYDAAAGLWSVWVETHWHICHSDTIIDYTIHQCCETGAAPLGFSDRFPVAIKRLLIGGAMLARPALAVDVIPFKNGLLDIDSRDLRAPSSEDATDWCLPHEYAPNATHERITDWLHWTVDGDGPTVEVLRALLAAVLRDIPVQHFLFLRGAPGTGKSTFARLLAAIVGPHNTATSTLDALENPNSQFEVAQHVGKRVSFIPEASESRLTRLPRLLAMTGRDRLAVERKNVQQTGSFVYGGLVVMTGNADMAGAGAGLDRRRITIAFNRRPVESQRREWDAAPGTGEADERYLHPQIPGLIAWALDFPPERITETLRRKSERIHQANTDAMRASQSVADWLLESMRPDTQADDKYSATLHREYSEWCSEQGRRPVSNRVFGASVEATSQGLGHELVTRATCPRKRTSILTGLRYARPDDPNDRESVWYPKRKYF